MQLLPGRGSRQGIYWRLLIRMNLGRRMFIIKFMISYIDNLLVCAKGVFHQPDLLKRGSRQKRRGPIDRLHNCT